MIVDSLRSHLLHSARSILFTLSSTFFLYLAPIYSKHSQCWSSRRHRLAHARGNVAEPRCADPETRAAPRRKNKQPPNDASIQ